MIVYCVLIMLLIIEHIYPFYPLQHEKLRWISHGVLFAIAIVLHWLTNVLLSFVVATPTTNQELTVSLFVIQFLLIDLLEYVLHRLHHHYRLLWAVHLVHHSDIELDATTQFRHHPLEMLIAIALFTLFIVSFSINPYVVLVYGVVATSIALWHHSNTRLLDNVDKLLCFLVITPRLHRLHHSRLRENTDSNYGVVFSLWDRVLGTLNDKTTQDGSDFGLEYFNSPQDQSLTKVIIQPVKYWQNQDNNRNHLSKKIDSV